ncbi:MAG: Lysophospholipase [Actinomycetia bacterium]|nr:Lysophospholipase [Actinomycetes bacterium]
MRRVKRAALGLLLAGGLLSAVPAAAAAGTAGPATPLDRAVAAAATATATATGYRTPAGSTPAGSAVTSIAATASQIVVTGRLAAADDPAGTSLALLTSGTQTLSQAVTIQHDSWNQVSIDVSSWPYRDDITGVSVSMAATGSSTPWTADFQLDDVGYTS